MSITASQLTAYEFFGPLTCALFSTLVPEATAFAIQYKAIYLIFGACPIIYHRLFRPSGYFPGKRSLAIVLVNLAILLLAFLFATFNQQFGLKSSADFNNIFESHPESVYVALIALAGLGISVLDLLLVAYPIFELSNSTMGGTRFVFPALLTSAIVLPFILPASIFSLLQSFQVFLCVPLIALSLILPVATSKWASLLYIFGGIIEVPLCIWSGLQMGSLFAFTGIAAASGAVLMCLSAAVALRTSEPPNDRIL